MNLPHIEFGFTMILGELVDPTYLGEPLLLFSSSWSLHMGFLSSCLLVRTSHHPVRASVRKRGQT